MHKVVTAAMAVAAPLLVLMPSADATQPVAQRRVGALAHIETKTLHAGKVQVTFTLYGPSGVIVQQSGISRIPAS
jgi:hypothetical protein